MKKMSNFVQVHILTNSFFYVWSVFLYTPFLCLSLSPRVWWFQRWTRLFIPIGAWDHFLSNMNFLPIFDWYEMVLMESIDGAPKGATFYPTRMVLNRNSFINRWKNCWTPLRHTNWIISHANEAICECSIQTIISWSEMSEFDAFLFFKSSIPKIDKSLKFV